MANVSGMNADEPSLREARCAKCRASAQVMANKTDLPSQDDQLLHALPDG